VHPQALASAAKIIMGRKGGVHRALRMVLVGDRRAEQRKNAVASRLYNPVHGRTYDGSDPFRHFLGDPRFDAVAARAPRQ
jgi:hypothetical protein